jgi:hypothetical protein
VPSHQTGLKLRSLGAELIIVVVGVIIALGMDSWWSGVQDGRRAEDHLIALADEFSENLDSLRGNIEREEHIMGAAAQLLGIMVGEVPRPSADSLVEITWEAFSFPPYEPLTTAYDNLVSTGDIALLDDEQLKGDLALFMSEVEHYRRGEWQMDQWNRHIAPFVGTEMVPLDWLPAGYRRERGVPDPSTRTDWDAMLRSRAFEGLLANRVIAASDNIANLKRVLPPAGRIVSRLNKLLSGVGGGTS